MNCAFARTRCSWRRWRVLADFTGSDTVHINLEGHGREDLFADVDLSRTVGWFTSLYPVTFRLPTDRRPGPMLKAVKEQLREIPQNGIGYGLLRWLAKDPSVRARWPRFGLSKCASTTLDSSIIRCHARRCLASRPSRLARASPRQRRGGTYGTLFALCASAAARGMAF